MSIDTVSADITLTPFDNKRLISLCGQLDEHLHLIENRLHTNIYNHGNIFHITGTSNDVKRTSKILEHLYEQTKDNVDLTPTMVHLSLQQVADHNFNVDITKQDSKTFKATTIKTPKGIISTRNKNQTKYVQSILENDINFGIGPAGTGKTFLAVACAVAALENKQIDRIILIRPVVEAGERLGFLPGDLAQKVDPYLRPLYDSLHEMLGGQKVAKLLEQQIIEIAPLAYMRGRTLNDAFIILDESQNTTVDQMKMFLTRIGFSSKAVITGDITQVDLPHGKLSGLKHVMTILQDIPKIDFSFFTSKDVVRHQLVQYIIDAYNKAKLLSSGLKP